MENLCPAVTLRTRLLQVATAIRVVLQFGCVVFVILLVLGALLLLLVVFLLVYLDILLFPSVEEFLYFLSFQMCVLELFLRDINWLIRFLRNRGAV